MAQNEKTYFGEVLLSEANGYRSRETVTLISGQNLKVGAILGVITASGKYTQCDNHTPAADGSQNAKAVLLEDVDASGGDKAALVARRDCEVKVGLLTYVAAASAGEKAAQLASLAGEHIIAR
jgi:hypothetical protein